jgi:hypothetical protein
MGFQLPVFSWDLDGLDTGSALSNVIGNPSMVEMKAIIYFRMETESNICDPGPDTRPYTKTK